MKILGIDYGRKKIGLAFAEGKLAQPYGVIRYKDIKILSEKIKKITIEQKAEKVVVGVSEGKMGIESKNFSLGLRKILKIPLETFDETLSTHEAQQLSREAGIGRKKRHTLEDAFAATVMLQSYLDYV